jgi:hypothetical protein
MEGDLITLTNYPPVSCFCSAYGKVHCLPELIQSFLQQNYEGKKELVILNDLAEQELIFNHPEVVIINSKQRYTPLGEKFNKNVEYCSHDYVAVMEIDDIYLPNHLTYAMQNMQNGIFHANLAYVWTGRNKPLHITGNYFHATHVYSKELFNKVGGYTKSIDNTTIDVNIIQSFQKEVGNYTKSPDYKDITYVYRWGVGGYHTSGWGTQINNVSDLAKLSIQQQIRAGIEPTGKIILEPKWNEPYDIMTQEALEAHYAKS